MVSSHTYIFEAINFDHHPAFLNWICFRHPGHPAVGIITKIFTLQRGGGLLCNTYHGKGKYAWWQVNSPAFQNWSSSIEIGVSQNKGRCEWIYLCFIWNIKSTLAWPTVQRSTVFNSNIGNTTLLLLREVFSNITFPQRYYRGRRAVHVTLSHIIILSGKSLSVSRCHRAHSQALWVVSCQVMETSLAQTRCECVLNAKQHVSLSSRQTEGGFETVVGKHSWTDRANQRRPPDVLKTAGKVTFRFGWLQSHTALGVSTWSHKTVDEKPQTTPL